MSLKSIRLELARNAEFPVGSASRGYEFKAPLTAEGALDVDAWREVRGDCVVRRFWEGQPDEAGLLLHTRGKRWMFSYDHPGEDDDHDDSPGGDPRHGPPVDANLHLLCGHRLRLRHHSSGYRYRGSWVPWNAWLQAELAGRG